jgi:hypothetical protein
MSPFNITMIPASVYTVKSSTPKIGTVSGLFTGIQVSNGGPPFRHNPSYGNVTDQELRELARVLGDTLRRLHDALNDPHFNLVYPHRAR